MSLGTHGDPLRGPVFIFLGVKDVGRPRRRFVVAAVWLLVDTVPVVAQAALAGHVAEDLNLSEKTE